MAVLLLAVFVTATFGVGSDIETGKVYKGKSSIQTQNSSGN